MECAVLPNRERSPSSVQILLAACIWVGMGGLRGAQSDGWVSQGFGSERCVIWGS